MFVGRGWTVAMCETDLMRHQLAVVLMKSLLLQLSPDFMLNLEPGAGEDPSSFKVKEK